MLYAFGAGSDGLPSDGEFFYEVRSQPKAAPGRVGHLDHPLRRNLYRRFDDVLFPVPLGGRNISRELEVGQGRKRDVVGTADACLQHATAPDRDTTAMGRVVHSNCFIKPAHASDLDVDNPARAQRNRGLCVAAAMNGFVETDGSRKLLLQLGMEIEIVMPQRLLDHEQIEAVELLEMRNLFQPVSGIRIATQQDLRPAIANLLKYFNIPAWFALDLDSAISGAKLSRNLLHQLLVRVLDADRYPARNLGLSSPQEFPQRHGPMLGLGVPYCIFQSA